MRADTGAGVTPLEDDGFWAVTRHARGEGGVKKTAQVYSSAIGHTNLWDLEADALEARRSLIDTDAPDHTRLRRLVAGSFTPRIRPAGGLTETVREISAELLDQGSWPRRGAATGWTG